MPGVSRRLLHAPPCLAGHCGHRLPPEGEETDRPVEAEEEGGHEAGAAHRHQHREVRGGGVQHHQADHDEDGGDDELEEVAHPEGGQQAGDAPAGSDDAEDTWTGEGDDGDIGGCGEDGGGDDDNDCDGYDN